CGHPFDASGAAAARAAGFRARHDVHPPGPSGVLKVGVGVLGYLLGALPLSFAAELQAATGHGENGLLNGISVLTGVIGVLVALRVLKRRHEARVRRDAPPV
ncbi:MAG TPA: hypothetical protein VHO06_11945, partial [Polyangia bacterium]|nr:hypothetical protein [Polyangia bacterium]